MERGRNNFPVLGQICSISNPKSWWNSKLFWCFWDLRSGKGGLKLWCIVEEVISSCSLVFYGHGDRPATWAWTRLGYDPNLAPFGRIFLMGLTGSTWFFYFYHILIHPVYPVKKWKLLRYRFTSNNFYTGQHREIGTRSIQGENLWFDSGRCVWYWNCIRKISTNRLNHNFAGHIRQCPLKSWILGWPCALLNYHLFHKWAKYTLLDRFKRKLKYVAALMF